MSKPTRRELAEVVLELSGKYSGPKVVKTLAAYLVRERRSHELDAIMREVARLRAAQTDTVEVTFTSAFPLKPKVKQLLLSKLPAKHAVMNEVIEPQVLGGVRMETSDLQLDLTVRNRLQKLKQGATN